MAVLRAALTLGKRQGKWRGDLEAIFPSSGDFSAGYDPRRASERALSRADVDALHAWATDPRLAPSVMAKACAVFAVIAYGIGTGSEIAAVERALWIDISEDRSVVHVRGTKNAHREADVPIATLAQALLLDFAMRHAPGTGDLLSSASCLGNIRRGFARAAIGTGVHHFSPHNVRHTLAQWLMAGGVQSAIVGRSLRQANGRMVESTLRGPPRRR